MNESHIEFDSLVEEATASDSTDTPQPQDTVDKSWFTCPHCRGLGSHLDWCPWLVRENSYPREAATLKFKCQYCNGIKCHQPECWWKLKYGSME